jgi:spermidine/putrescine ABC transporter ATP-binding subunit
VADSMLILDGIVKRYGDTSAVGPISFTVDDGEFISLLGPSGCGKTTTLNIIAGLLQPTAGRVMIAGQDVTDLEPRHRGMGVVFQSYALFPHRTVFQNVAFGLRMRKVPREEIRTRVQAMLKLVGLPGVGDRLCDQISGGQRQRVALARALVIEPRILLLDEPLSNLDAQLRKRMRQELRDLQQRVGITTLFVTHDQDEAFEMSDRVILLNHGRIEQSGRPEEIYDSPATRFAAEFIGNVNLLEGHVIRIDGSQVRVSVSEALTMSGVASRSGFAPQEPVYLMLRPECIDLHARLPAGQEALSARIRRRVFSGDVVSFELDTDSGHSLLCTKPSRDEFRNFKPGQAVWVVPEACRVLPRAS